MVSMRASARAFDVPSLTPPYRPYVPPVPVDLSTFQGRWDVSTSSSTVITNTGTAGAALNTTHSGMNQAVGPGVWLPDTTYSSVCWGNQINWTTWGANNLLRLEICIQSFSNTIELIGAYRVELYIQAGILKFSCYINGVSRVMTLGAVTTGIKYWYAVEYDKTTGVVTGYQSADGVTWVPVGTSAEAIGGTVATTTGNDNVYHGNYISAVVASGSAVLYASRVTANGVDHWKFVPGDIPTQPNYPTDPTDITFPVTTGGIMHIYPANYLAPGEPQVRIVPTGKTLYVNPVHTTAANRIIVPDNAAFDILNTEDVVMFWVGASGAAITTNGYLFNTDSSGASVPLTLQKLASTDKISATSQLSGSPIVTAEATNTIIKQEYHCVIGLLDRATNMVTVKVYGSTGLVSSVSSSAVGVLGGGSTAGPELMKAIPGSVNYFGWKKGVGIIPSDASLLLLAQTLLTGWV